jgi:septal ring factor EnvC (AmiA/AmiB activator)
MCSTLGVVADYTPEGFARAGELAYTGRPMRLIRRLPLLLIAATLHGVGAAAQDDMAQAEADLAAVREQIQRLEQDVRQQVAERGGTERDLRAAEIAEAEGRRRLREIGGQLAGARERLESLAKQAEASRSDLASRRADLERQLRLAYVTGQEEWLRLVLSQRDPAKIGRQIVYYSYITRERSTIMEAVRARLRELEKNAAEVERERDRLKELERDERVRLQQIEVARRDRGSALARLDRRIQSGKGEIDTLRQQAEDLEALVAELTRLIVGLPVADAIPFEEMKGHLESPTAGSLVGKYGATRADGRLRWDGLLLAAAAGAEVRAVHHGRVVFADWLPGLGLLTVVEHGDGYLSLYGHNRDLLKDVGEWVRPGDVIAHVGDSGGQAAAGLYFEIRKDGRPVDPGLWLGR